MLDDIKQSLSDTFAPEALQVNQEGSHFEVLIVSVIFEGLNKLKRQQKVYACLNPWITSGELHAVTMHTHTPDEWTKINHRGF